MMKYDLKTRLAVTCRACGGFADTKEMIKHYATCELSETSMIDEVVKLKEQLQAAEAALDLFETASVNKGPVHMYSDEEEARDALTAYQQKYHPEKGQTG